MPELSEASRRPARETARPSLAEKTSGAVGRRPAAEAWPELVRGIPRDAGRWLFVGVTGSGKTTALRAFLDATKEKFEVILVHDQKRADTEFPSLGEVVHRIDLDGILERAEKETEDYDVARPVILVVRGEPVESLAALALTLGNLGVETLLVVGELSKAVTDGGKELTSPSLRIVLLEGRARHVSLAATTQMATRTPGVFFDNAKTIMFNPGRKAQGYLERNDVVGPDELAVLPGLAVMDQGGVGEFIIAATDKDWDGRVYVIRP